MTHSHPALLYFGHHKCATTSTNGIAGLLCRELGLSHETAVNAEQFQACAENAGAGFIAYTNTQPQHVKLLPDFVGFHLIRDPRDIVVSAYFSHRVSHPLSQTFPELAGIRSDLRRVSKEQGLMMTMETLDSVLQAIGDWDYEQPNVLELRMEDLVRDPYRTWLKAFNYLGLVRNEDLSLARRFSYTVSAATLRLGLTGPHRLHRRTVPVERFLGIAWDYDFPQQANGRMPGEEDPTSHYRKGIAGDWKNHFTPAVVERFKEAYNPILMRLGYVSDSDWGLAASARAFVQ